MNFREFNRTFLDYEDRHLQLISGENSLLWEMARFPIYSRLIVANGLHGVNPDSNKTIAHRILTSAAKGALPSVVSLARIRTLRHRPLLFDSSRLQMDDTGGISDIILDPFYSVADEPVVSRSGRWPFRSRLSKNNLDTTMLGLAGRVGAKISSVKPKQTSVHEFVRRLQKEFSTDEDYLYMLDQFMWQKKFLVTQYGRLLDYLEPEYVILVCSYGKEPLINACRKRDIPVAELQHGVISRYHMGYSTLGLFKKQELPDRFFAFGRYWTELEGFPFNQNQVVITGYTHLNKSLELYRQTTKQQKIVVISQPVIGEELSQWIVKLGESLNWSIPIVYKLHPKENSAKNGPYECLADSPVDVIGPDIPLHKVLAESSHALGVFSTAIFEALSFGCIVSLVDLPGVEYMDDLVDEGYVHRVSSVDSYDLDWLPAPFQSDSFFSGSGEKTKKNALEQLSRLGQVF